MSKSKDGMLGFMSDLLSTQKKPKISGPFSPTLLAHVTYNESTGEFKGLPKEWQILLQESGISRSEQESNPQAVMEIVKFYQETTGNNMEGDEIFSRRRALPPPPIKKYSPPPQDYSSASSPPALARSTSVRTPASYQTVDESFAGYPNPGVPPPKIRHSPSLSLSPRRYLSDPPTSTPSALDRSTSVRTPTSQRNPGPADGIGLVRANTHQDPATTRQASRGNVDRRKKSKPRKIKDPDRQRARAEPKADEPIGAIDNKPLILWISAVK